MAQFLNDSMDCTGTKPARGISGKRRFRLKAGMTANTGSFLFDTQGCLPVVLAISDVQQRPVPGGQKKHKAL